MINPRRDFNVERNPLPSVPFRPTIRRCRVFSARRQYMRALAMHERELERRNRMITAEAAREERARKLATMTEEQKVAFVEQEKQEKKKQWIKKQVRLPVPQLAYRSGGVLSSRRVGGQGEVTDLVCSCPPPRKSNGRLS